MSIYLKANDTHPSIEGICEAPPGTPADLTGAGVQFIMTVLGTDVEKVNRAATVVDAAAGHVRYTWQTGDTDTRGTYRARFRVTFAGGEVRTWPSSEYLYVQID